MILSEEIFDDNVEENIESIELEENLFDCFNEKVNVNGVRRPTAYKNHRAKTKPLSVHVYDELDKLGYEVFASNAFDGFIISKFGTKNGGSKFIKDIKLFDKAINLLNALNISYKISDGLGGTKKLVITLPEEDEDTTISYFSENKSNSSSITVNVNNLSRYYDNPYGNIYYKDVDMDNFEVVDGFSEEEILAAMGNGVKFIFKKGPASAPFNENWTDKMSREELENTIYEIFNQCQECDMEEYFYEETRLNRDFDLSELDEDELRFIADNLNRKGFTDQTLYDDYANGIDWEPGKYIVRESKEKFVKAPSKKLTEGQTRFSEIDTDLSQEIFNVVLPKKVIADDLVSFMYQFNDGLKAGMNKMELLVALKDARTPDEFGRYVYNNCDREKYNKIYNESKKTKVEDVEYGVNNDGDLYLGDKESGYTLPDTNDNRRKIALDYFQQTGKDVSKDFFDSDDLDEDLFNLEKDRDIRKQQLQGIVDNAIKVFGRIPGGIINDLDEVGYYAQEQEDGSWVVKDKKDIPVNESFEDEHGVESITEEQPQVDIPAQDPQNENNGLVAIINNLIKDEWDTIQAYKDAIVNFASQNKNDLTTALEDILNEENVHVGQLETLLKSLDASAENIEQGKQEAEEQIDLATNTTIEGDKE